MSAHLGIPWVRGEAIAGSGHSPWRSIKKKSATTGSGDMLKNFPSNTAGAGVQCTMWPFGSRCAAKLSGVNASSHGRGLPAEAESPRSGDWTLNVPRKAEWVRQPLVSSPTPGTGRAPDQQGWTSKAPPATRGRQVHTLLYGQARPEQTRKPSQVLGVQDDHLPYSCVLKTSRI